MCSVMGAAMTAQGAGGVLSAYSSINQGRMQERQYNFMADTKDLQAKVIETTAERQVTDTADAAARDTAKLNRQGRQFAASQRAAMAAAGVEGVTAEDLAGDTQDKLALDEAAIRFNANSQSLAIRRAADMEAWSLRTGGRMDRIYGADARAAGNIGAISSILGTAASVAGTYAMWQRTSQGRQPTTAPARTDPIYRPAGTPSYTSPFSLSPYRPIYGGSPMGRL